MSREESIRVLAKHFARKVTVHCGYLMFYGARPGAVNLLARHDRHIRTTGTRVMMSMPVATDAREWWRELVTDMLFTVVRMGGANA